MGIYLRNECLQKELIISNGKGKLTKKCEEYLILLCENIGYKFGKLYIGQPDNFHDCKSDAMLHVFLQWRKYSTYNENPIAYFTEIYKRAMSGAYAKVVLRKSNYKQDTIEFVRMDIYLKW